MIPVEKSKIADLVAKDRAAEIHMVHMEKVRLGAPDLSCSEEELRKQQKAQLGSTLYKGFQKSDGTFVDHAYVHGYHFGDRLLEGVFFKITINPNGSLRATTPKQYAKYMDNLNEAKWLGVAMAFAERLDVFFDNEGGNEGDELVLVKR